MPTTKKKQQSATPASARRVRGGLPCPECSFVARHAMGLGRHRSARHGVASKRSARTTGPGMWLSRHQAAERAGVHYNTIRGWEDGGLLRTTKKPGVRGVLVSRADLDRLLAERAGTMVPMPAGVSDEALAAMQRRYNELVEALEELLSQARAARPRRRRGRPPGKARTAAEETTKRSPTRRGRKPAKRPSAKARGTRARARKRR